MRRLAIAVEPLLLASSLAEVFGDAYDVMVCTADNAQNGHADLAIVSDSRRHLVHADTVISLPDIEGNAGLAVIWRGDQATPVAIGTLSDLIRMVETVPA